MKTIRVAHLYYDLMNLYGDNGNIRALVKQLEYQGLKVVVDFLSLEDIIDFAKYDICYIGSGTAENAKLVLDSLISNKESLQDYVKSNKYLIVTGDTVAIFGKKFIYQDNEYEGLDIAPYVGRQIEFRIIGEQFYTSDVINKDIIGMQNRETVIDNYEEGIFKVDVGTGFKPKMKVEGIRVNNFIGTYLLGPLLVRNPYLTEYLIKDILNNYGMKYKKIKEDISYTAYWTFLENFKDKENY